MRRIFGATAGNEDHKREREGGRVHYKEKILRPVNLYFF